MEQPTKGGSAVATHLAAAALLALTHCSEGAMTSADGAAPRDSGADADARGDGATDASICESFSTDTRWCSSRQISHRTPEHPVQGEPAIAVDSDDRIAVAWTEGTDQVLHIRAASSANDFGEGAIVSNPEVLAFNPTIAAAGERTYLAYAQTDATNAISIYLTVSEDGGQTWSAPVAASEAPGIYDFPRISTGPDGAVYLVWVRITTQTGENSLRITRSVDAGASFSVVAELNTPRTVGRRYASPVAVAADGTLLVGYLEFTRDGIVRSVVSRILEKRGEIEDVVVAENEHENIVSMEDVARLSQSFVASLTASGDTACFAYTSTAGDWSRDLYAATSDDSGASFASPLRLNETEGSIAGIIPQFALTADDSGGCHVIWYDSGTGPWSLLAASTRGGDTWSLPERASDTTFEFGGWTTNFYANPRWLGHSFGLAARNGSLFAAWADLRTGEAEVFTARTISAAH